MYIFSIRMDGMNESLVGTRAKLVFFFLNEPGRVNRQDRQAGRTGYKNTWKLFVREFGKFFGSCHCGRHLETIWGAGPVQAIQFEIKSIPL